MNFFPHIPMLATVFNSIGCYLLPFGIVLLWLLCKSRKAKVVLLAGLVLLSMVCMFFHEACAPSRDYPWDCMIEHVFTGTLLPFLCLLGYILYVFLCTCIPVYRKVWKGIGFLVLGGMSLASEYVNVFFPVMLLAGCLFRLIIFRQFQSHISFVRKCHGVLAIGVVPGICLLSIVSAVLFPPPESFICGKIEEEMAHDMALWNYQSNLVLLSSRFLNLERNNDGITVKYYCETNMGPAVYRAFCNNYGGYLKAECSLLNREAL